MKDAKLNPVTKERLMGYKQLVDELERQIDRAAMKRSQLESPPKVCGGMPHSNYVADKIAIGVAELIELERIRDEGITRLDEEASVLEAAVQLLKDPREREVLRLRYFECRDWAYIGVTIGYEESQTYSLHRRALQSIYDATNPWPKKHRSKS